MVAFGFLGHTSIDGSPFWRRIERFYRPGAGAVGETLAYQDGRLKPDDIVDRWLASPGHRRIILDGEWRDIGLGVVEAVGAPGVFGGGDVVVVTADFGVRR